MKTEVLPDDHYARDVITLPGTKQELLVNAVLIGQNGFILTVVVASSSAPIVQLVATSLGFAPARLTEKTRSAR